MEAIKSVSIRRRLNKDFASRCLKMEIQCLQGLLKNVENQEWPGDSYMTESLKMSMVNLEGLIKFLSH